MYIFNHENQFTIQLASTNVPNGTQITHDIVPYMPICKKQIRFLK